VPGWVLAFLAVDIPMIVIPGPDFAVITKNGLVGGRRLALPTAVGAATGLIVWGGLAVAGIATALAVSAVAYSVVKLAGAAYLVVLGILAFKHAGRGSAERPAGRATSSRRAFVQGFLNDVLNPKSAVLYVALIPQFVPGSHPALLDILLLATINNLLALVWFVVVAVFVGYVRESLGRRNVRLWLERVTGLVLVGLGLRLAAESR